MQIQIESAADIAGIRAVHQAAFPTPAEAALVDALRAAGQLSLSLVARQQERVVGHVAFSPIHVDAAPLGWGLGPVAVHAEQRGRGVAAHLIRDGLERVRAAGVGLVVVLGDPRYYSRFGFTPARLLALRDEYAGGDAFQALELVRGTAPAAGGLVRYSSAFAQLGV
jgi:putative acetyltransferase